MNRRYFIRSVMRAYELPAELLRVDVNCWRCTWYIGQRYFASGGTFDGVNLQGLDPGAQMVYPLPLVFGGYTGPGEPVPFIHSFEFQGHGVGFGLGNVWCKLEYMEPFPDATR